MKRVESSLVIFLSLNLKAYQVAFTSLYICRVLNIAVHPLMTILLHTPEKLKFIKRYKTILQSSIK